MPMAREWRDWTDSRALEIIAALKERNRGKIIHPNHVEIFELDEAPLNTVDGWTGLHSKGVQNALVGFVYPAKVEFIDGDNPQLKVTFLIGYDFSR